VEARPAKVKNFDARARWRAFTQLEEPLRFAVLVAFVALLLSAFGAGLKIG